ncbi:MAG TPA: AbrB/MazE/SpoVT family DNA-binding domain-containing protein [Porticoccaceae bacterium]|jgi:antitoxin VapB|nr:AbrB/MazE/SpoVT family DNA-binding domain-containing protein [Porticoccaceae bacterium]
MSKGFVFSCNRSQVVLLPAGCLPDNVKKVDVRVVGKDRELSPINSTWDSFFLSEQRVSDDFMQERASQK